MRKKCATLLPAIQISMHSMGLERIKIIRLENVFVRICAVQHNNTVLSIVCAIICLNTPTRQIKITIFFWISIFSFYFVFSITFFASPCSCIAARCTFLSMRLISLSLSLALSLYALYSSLSCSFLSCAQNICICQCVLWNLLNLDITICLREYCTW